MIGFPNAKINIGLYITEKRKDGYHNIETLFYPIGLKDCLEFVRNPEQSSSGTTTDLLTLNQTGLQIDGDFNENLITKAYFLLRKDFSFIPPIQVYLHKVIPMGAGLGGGSSDAACMLKLLCDEFELGLGIEELLDYALRLGSDCPFFILNKPCIGRGRGEQLTECEIDLREYWICVVNPGIHISTSWAFSQIKPQEPCDSIESIITKHPSEWKGRLKNDFEDVVVAKYPAISEIIEKMYVHGAYYASLSGSGSSVYGIFPKGLKPDLDFPDGYYVFWESKEVI